MPPIQFVSLNLPPQNHYHWYSWASLAVSECIEALPYHGRHAKYEWQIRSWLTSLSLLHSARSPGRAVYSEFIIPSSLPTFPWFVWYLCRNLIDILLSFLEQVGSALPSLWESPRNAKTGPLTLTKLSSSSWTPPIPGPSSFLPTMRISSKAAWWNSVTCML